MKRFIVVPLLIAALAAPAVASAFDASVEPAESAKGGGFSVRFEVIKQGNDPVAVKRFKFRRLPVECTGGSFLLKGKVGGKLPVNNNGRFGATAIAPEGGEVKVNGEFVNNNQKVKGRVKATGDFEGIDNCEGAKRYVAT
jgi:opacity protein-like surface antigen